MAIAFIDLAESSIQPYLQQYAVSLGTTAVLAGLCVGVNQIVRAGAGPLAGLWSDTVGKRRPFVVGVGVLVVSYLIGYLDRDFAWLLASRMLVGVGYAIVSVTMMSHVGSCLTVRQRGLGYSLFINASAASMVLAPLIGGTISQLYGYRYIFAVGSALALCGLAFSRLLPSSPVPGPSNLGNLGIRETLTSISKSRNAMAIAVELFGIGLGWISFLYYVIPVYGRQALGFSDLQIGMLVSIVGVSHLISSISAGPLSDKFRSRRPFVFGGALLAGVTLFLTPLAHNFLDLALLVAGYAFFIGLQCPTSLALVADSVDRSFLGSSLGVISGIEMLGMFIGPILCASTLTTLGLQSVYLIPAIGLTIPAILFLLVSERPGDVAATYLKRRKSL